MASTPGKRPRPATSDGDGGGDNDPTPRQAQAGPSYREVLTRRQILQPDSPSAAKSKTKTIADLSRLAVPVVFSFPHKIADVLPSHALALCRKLRLVERDQKILPIQLKAQIEGVVGAEEILPFMWNAKHEKLLHLQSEFDEVRKIVKNSERAFQGRHAEASWNESVHRKAVELALKRHPAVGVFNITRAQIAEPFRPRLHGRDDVASLASTSTTSMSTNSTASDTSKKGTSKMVDYALFLDIDAPPDELDPQTAESYARLSTRIDRFLDCQPEHEQWLNSTSYWALRRLPAPIVIETKSGTGKPEDARVQLGVWLAGWHHRIRQMLDKAGRAAGDNTVLAVPTIMVFEGDWEILFVLDARGLATPVEQIHIIGPSVKIGNTTSMTGLYRLLAALRTIVDWMEVEFRPWINNLLGDIVEPAAVST